MGIIWRFTMVLLSTLAALVIIVHTAEEEIELTYRRDLRSRDLYNGTPQYEQTWKGSEVDSTAQKSIQLPSDTWNNNSPEEPPKRRRPGRKRKRRPQQNPNKDIITQESYTYPEESPQTYIETNVRNVEMAEVPKRRRKKLDQTPHEWQAETPERPLRRRRRKKKPSSSNWPELSEFNVPQPEEIRLGSILDPSEVTDGGIYTDTEGIRQLIEQNQSGNEDQQEVKMDRTLMDLRQQKINDRLIVHELKEPLTKFTTTKEDKSLSEFSLELPEPSKHSKYDGSIFNDTDSFQKKRQDKTFGVVRTFSKVQDKGPMDPVTLKEILKRSNSISLSEILQQHNLSLADLLSGRESAISILNSENSDENSVPRSIESEDQRKESEKVANIYKSINKPKTETSGESVFLNLATNHGETRLVFENNTTTQETRSNFQGEIKNDKLPPFDTNVDTEITPKLVNRRRLSGSRRRLRMRPMMNSTYKSQLSRDLISLNPRQQMKELQRNPSKHSESNKDDILLNGNNTHQSTLSERNNISRNFNGGINTISIVTNKPFSNVSSSQTFLNKEARQESINKETPTTITSFASAKITVPPVRIRENKVVTPVVRHSANASILRQQAFNNRLKRKRLKHKNITTESPQDNVLTHFYGVSDLVSSTELAERTRSPQVKLDENKHITTPLDDYIMSANISKAFNNVTKARLPSQGRTSSTTKSPITSSTTEESARFEIEEILNDIGTSARLSRILMERNMTLSELVEHRERGSSNIHLADIFHNTSKEPNPPVPFLSKSLIEPISKETYPLRALLEANLHETTGKLAALDTGRSNVNIPIVMDFGNNVNENAENMGIISLFSNFTKHGDITNKNTNQTSEGGDNKPIVIAMNAATYDKNGNTTREGKMMNNINNQDDIVSWNEIFTLMRKTYKNETGTIPETLKEDPKPGGLFPKLPLDEDIDGDGLLILEDLQHLKDFDSKFATAGHEKVEVKTYERIEAATEVTGTLDKIPSQTKSVTVATACIAGLAIVLFLLIYAAFKWKQEKNSLQKCDVEGENIPSPVFENRKNHKNNNSIRSISPMLSTSNIYTRNTLDSRNGNESPEYMWDTLRKPFQ